MMVDTLKIIRPLKVYLDTNHLIKIADFRKDAHVHERFRQAYQRLDSRIRNDHIGLVHSEVAPLDWVDGDATLESANEIADVIDSAKLRYYFEGDDWIFLYEVFEECSRIDPTLGLPDIPILQPMNRTGSVETAGGILYPGIFPRKRPAYSARQQIRHAFDFKRNNSETYHERESGFSESFSRDCQGRPKGDYDQSDIVDGIKRYLEGGKLLTQFNADIDLECLLEDFDIDNCPSIKLWYQTRSMRIRAKHPLSDNDVDDWVFMPVIPYCDVTLTDRQFRTFILQGDPSLEEKVFSDPNKAADAIDHIWQS